MSIERGNPGEHAAHWRRVLNKPERGAADGKLTQAERIAAWSARNRQDEAKSTQTRAAVERTRRDVLTPGTTYAVGAERHAMDGTRWKRVA
ncbi:hypothetical protein [Methylobacterium sp. J-076]|uniref:hypothetical protein n=1 Tax=Methylobacterium sp. J-076 TaxID=2836655 RepID=UPI001FB9B522|nr:hypothetical protein [Methylobacterium sp. J-076]MCJ2010965.1 hypothetical protein [Methylobacterium sp. J-076]